MATKSQLYKPYNYQEPVIGIVRRAVSETGRALFYMATGLGKTPVSAFVIKNRLRSGKKGLFLCHDNEILRKAQKEYKMVVGTKKKNGAPIIFDTFYGNRKAVDPELADMLFGSFQTMNSHHEKWYEYFEQNHFDFLVVDEGHHGYAPTFKEVIDYFECDLIGMTATPERADEKDIQDIFGPVVADIPLEKAIARGWLAQVEYHILSDSLSNSKLRKVCRDALEEGQRISVKQINETIFIQNRDIEQSRIISEYAQIAKYSKGKQTMIFCESIFHAKMFAKYVQDAVVVHSKLSNKSNEKSLEKFRNREVQYIISVNKLNEGIDIPDAEVVVFLRATDSKRIWFQQLGRGLRLKDGKEKVIVLDFVANCERLLMIRELIERVDDFKPKKSEVDLVKNVLEVTGDGFEFTFADELVDLLQVIEVLKKGFYDTWQEASRVCIKAGVLGSIDYRTRYRKIDLRLPSTPDRLYPDFPGWYVFLGIVFATWQEASAVCKKAGFVSGNDYAARCKSVDQRLLVNPRDRYKDFPGWVEYLGLPLPPKGWETLQGLQRLLSRKGIKREGLKSFLKFYHAKYVQSFWNSNNERMSDHFSPALVRFTLYHFGKRDKLIADGWKSKYAFRRELDVGMKFAANYAKDFKQTRSEWFESLWVYGSFVEHYHPVLVGLIENHSTGLVIAPLGWETLNKLQQELPVGYMSIKAFAGGYRACHSDAFRVYRINDVGNSCEHYSPALSRLIKWYFNAERITPPEGWCRLNSFVKKEKLGARNTLLGFIQSYRVSNPNWFKEYWFFNGMVEYFHPDLVELIKQHFAKDKK